MAETLALPSAFPTPSYAARAGQASGADSNTTGTPFKHILRLSNAQNRAARAHSSSKDVAQAGGLAPAAYAATRPPPQPHSAPAARDAGNSVADGSPSPEAALSALEGTLSALTPGAPPVSAAGPAAPVAVRGLAAPAGPAQAAAATAPPATPAADTAVTTPATAAAAGTAKAATQNGSQPGMWVLTATHADGLFAPVTVIAATAGDLQPAALNGGTKDMQDHATAAVPATAAAGGASTASVGVWKLHTAPATAPAATGMTGVSAAGAVQAGLAAMTTPAQPRATVTGWARASTQTPPAPTGPAAVDTTPGIDSSLPVKTIDQVADALVMTIRSGKSEATITLHPAALGEVKAQIISGPNGLVIRLSAEHQAVGDLLRSHAGELREALAGQQIAVSELHVLHNAPAPAAANTHDGAAWQERQRPQPGDDSTQGQRNNRQQPDSEETEAG